MRDGADILKIDWLWVGKAIGKRSLTVEQIAVAVKTVLIVDVSASIDRIVINLHSGVAIRRVLTDYFVAYRIFEFAEVVALVKDLELCRGCRVYLAQFDRGIEGRLNHLVSRPSDQAGDSKQEETA